jgi:hypothetical protein
MSYLTIGIGMLPTPSQWDYMVNVKIPILSGLLAYAANTPITLPDNIPVYPFDNGRSHQSSAPYRHISLPTSFTLCPPGVFELVCLFSFIGTPLPAWVAKSPAPFTSFDGCVCYLGMGLQPAFCPSYGTW